MRDLVRWMVSLGVCLALLGGVCLGAPAKPTVQLKEYDAKYYKFQTDCDEETVAEGIVRLIAMVDEYTARTRGFAGGLRGKLPFKLFSNAKDYADAGAPSGSCGVFMVRGNTSVLMAIANKDNPEQTWHTVRHEGFHQFAAQVIRGNIPVWLNEGMAEYFGEGLWTGDGLIVGVIPPGRMKMVRDLIETKKLLDFDKMVAMSHDEWNKALNYNNYTQAWSMVHFLAHAEGGKYQKPFVDFINDVAGGKQPWPAWTSHFGRDQDAFEKKYCEWWNALDANPTFDLYTQATVETLTAHLARAYFLKQKYATADEFFAACKDGKLAFDTKKHGRIWLPAGLLTDTLAKAEKLKEWSLDAPEKKLPKLKLTLADGTVFTGSFTPDADGPGKAKVEITKPKPATASAPASGPK
jgi:hypothetical protein